MKFKVFFHLPLPIKNHFYKGNRISFKKNWFCTSCENDFNFKPWKLYKNKSMLDIVCPYCGSESIYNSTELSKALIDKKPIAELLKIIVDINQKSEKIKSSFIENQTLQQSFDTVRN
jgi:DNA-directed RNA polymerase subunit RPC12/RpoP